MKTDARDDRGEDAPFLKDAMLDHQDAEHSLSGTSRTYDCKFPPSYPVQLVSSPRGKDQRAIPYWGFISIYNVVLYMGTLALDSDDPDHW